MLRQTLASLAGPAIAVLACPGLPASAQTLFQYFLPAEGDALFGLRVTAAGDLDHDGRPDVLVAGVDEDDFHFVRAHSGFTGAVLFELWDALPHGFFGYGLDLVGDVNDDGTEDFIVGGIHTGVGSNEAGGALVCSGVDGAVIYSYSGASEEDRMGYSACGAGDVDADGTPDFAIGVLWLSTNHLKAGGVEVYSGRDGSLLHRFDGPEPLAFMGASVAGAGDVDQDGFDDVLVGGYGRVGGDPAPDGRARVHSGRTGALLYEFLGQGGDRFGEYLDGGQDVDGDGVPDFLLMARGSVLTPAPELFVHSGADGSTIHAFALGHDRGGSSASFMGDVDGDGLADFASGWSSAQVGGPAGVDVFPGRDASLLLVIPDARQVAEIGAFDGDGLDDVLVGLGAYGAEGVGAAAVYIAGPCAMSPVCAISPNSVGPGAVLVGEGSLSLAENDFELQAHLCPPGQLGIFLYGDTSVELPFGDGLRCVGGGGSGVHRLRPASPIDASGVARFDVDFEAAPMDAGPGEIRCVRPWYFQFWYRDPAGPLGSGFNLSDSLRIVFCP